MQTFILVFGPPLQRQSAISTSTNSEMSWWIKGQLRHWKSKCSQRLLLITRQHPWTRWLSSQHQGKALSKLSSISISSAEICGLLRNLKTDKAVGVDEIPNSLLRLSAPAICHSLAWLFKRSLDLGKLPLQWKTSKIIPIYKKGPRDSPDDYRPISLLPAVAKILAAIVNR